MRKKEEGWLAMQVHRTPSSGNTKCREEFLTNLEEIKIALKTCTVRSVWQTMANLKIYSGSYVGFWKLVQKYCPKQAIPAFSSEPAKPQPREPAAAMPPPEKSEPTAITLKPVSWEMPTSRPKRELILDGKPMNSDGETID